MSLASTLLALPILTVVSIPLILSALVTVSLALITLTLRLTVIYIELSYALLVNFFTLPKTTFSLLTFAGSEPTSPVVGRSRRNSAYGLVQSSRSKDSLTAWALNEIHEDMATCQRRKYARSMVEAHHLSTTSYYDPLIRGDEGRDFEGVGGWRPYHNLLKAKKRGPQPLLEKPLRSLSPSAVQSPTGDMNLDADIDADERAWLSINHRLELPSQVVTLSTSSTATSNVTSPIIMGHLDFRNGFHAIAPSSARHNSNSGRPRHHRRSHTTSSLTTSNIRAGDGLSLSPLTRSGPTEHHTRENGHPMSATTSRTNPSMTPQPYSHIQMPRKPYSRTPATSSSHSNSHRFGSVEEFGISASGNPGNISNGYFALQRPRTLHMPNPPDTGSASSSGRNTPICMESRDLSSPQLTHLTAHYPTCVRQRRRSISGPHTGKYH